ncbi:MAG: hypothetical protein HFF26_02510 [Oscillospiraceae bacterium]|nr:hypothetical protein [Oscillospiraceae bacterium]MDE6840507.1 hypothetical protein [Oscillospiraceae bacterium]
MRQQLQGIALILIGILFTLVCMIDPWIPMIGDVGRAMYPVIAAAASIAGLVLVFRRNAD